MCRGAQLVLGVSVSPPILAVPERQRLSGVQRPQALGRAEVLCVGGVAPQPSLGVQAGLNRPGEAGWLPSWGDTSPKSCPLVQPLPQQATGGTLNTPGPGTLRCYQLSCVITTAVHGDWGRADASCSLCLLPLKRRQGLSSGARGAAGLLDEGPRGQCP